MISKELIKRILSSIILLPSIILITIKGSYYFDALIALCFIISIFEWINITKKIIFKFFGIFFLIFSFYSIYKLHNFIDDGYLYVLLVTLICVATDIGGFIFGKAFKGPKLTKLSPNKTYSGMIGSFILTIFFIYLFSEKFFLKNSYNLTLEIIFFSIFISFISQIGDISISYFKRLSNIKDTGKIIPGHGGLLDRIDGMIFAFSASYILISTTNVSFF
jgi:phosphatidate cytidylyltransferase